MVSSLLFLYAEAIMTIRERKSLPINVALLLVTLSGFVFGQRTSAGTPTTPIRASISGVVRSSDNGAPIEFVNVSLESNVGGVVNQVRTDRSGKFRFDNLAQGAFRISIHHVGFVEVQRYVDLTTTTTEYLQIQLVAEKSDSLPVRNQTINANVSPDAQQEIEKGRTALVDEKNLQSSITHLEKAVSLAPQYAEAHLLLGTAYTSNKQLDKAEREFHKTVEIDSKAATAYFALGDVYRQQQKYAEAEKVLQDGLKLDPKSPLGHLTLGQVYFAKNDVTKAGPEVGQALQLKPDYAEAYLLAGNLFLRARNAASALQMYEQYLRLEPKGQHASQAREMVEKIKKALAEKKQ